MPWSMFIIYREKKKRHARDLTSLLFLIGINKYTPNEPTWSRLNLCFVKIPNIIAYLKTSRTSKVAVEGKSVSTYYYFFYLYIIKVNWISAFPCFLLHTIFNIHEEEHHNFLWKKFLSFLINTQGLTSFSRIPTLADTMIYNI